MRNFLKSLDTLDIVLVGMLAYLSVVIYSGLSTRNQHQSTLSKAQATVMITNLQENSGGTGSVISSNDTESTVLTNEHVCGVVKNGGVVRTDSQFAIVTAYTTSKYHDLCLIKVNANLGVNSVVAKQSPDTYTEASVSGHPKLLGTILTKGNFSGNRSVVIMTGFRECTEKDLQSSEGAFVCILLGGMPILRNYEAQVIGATIQAGNSGSAVYNEQGEIAGVVFAGFGDMSYGLIVPHKFVANFLNKEVPKAEWTQPNNEVSLDGTSSDNASPHKSILKESCLKLAMGDTNYLPIKSYCGMATDLIYTK